jgi:hypothetical protein
MLIEQTYPGMEDVDLHFYALLSAFRDRRYFRVQDKPLFLIYDSAHIPDVDRFIDRWNELAVRNGLPGVFFVVETDSVSEVAGLEERKYDAINLCLNGIPFGGRATSVLARARRYGKALLARMPNAVDYSDAIESLYDPIMREENVFPTLIPNFDHTPRSGLLGRLYYNSSPERFGEHASMVLRNITHKDPAMQIAFVKSWNEWGEGNYMEPDLRWGKAYIHTLARVKANVEREGPAST